MAPSSETMGQRVRARAARRRAWNELTVEAAGQRLAVSSAEAIATRAASDQHQALMSVVCQMADRRRNRMTRPTTSVKVAAIARDHSTGITATESVIASSGTGRMSAEVDGCQTMQEIAEWSRGQAAPVDDLS